MKICWVIGQDSNSKFTKGTRIEARNTMERIVQEEGVRLFCAFGTNDFEAGCCDMANVLREGKTKGNILLGILGVPSLMQNDLSREIWGKWAYCCKPQHIPPRVWIRATKKMAEHADCVLLGTQNANDLVSAAEYARSLGKPVYKVFA